MRAGFEAVLMDNLHRQYTSGDRAALLRAVRRVLQTCKSSPPWVTKEYCGALARWEKVECPELGDAFGVGWPKGKQVAAAQRFQRYGALVFNAVMYRPLKEGKRVPIDDALFEHIGKRLNLSPSTVKRYWARAKQLVTSDNA
jgi:hypothetical protein